MPATVDAHVPGDADEGVVLGLLEGQVVDVEVVDLLADLDVVAEPAGAVEHRGDPSLVLTLHVALDGGQPRTGELGIVGQVVGSAADR